MGPKDWLPRIKKLKTRAHDNHGHRYAVFLEFDRGPQKWILKIDKTPGQWYMSSIMERGYRNEVSVDFGQKWDIVNFYDIMQEAVTLI